MSALKNHQVVAGCSNIPQQQSLIVSELCSRFHNAFLNRMVTSDSPFLPENLLAHVFRRFTFHPLLSALATLSHPPGLINNNSFCRWTPIQFYAETNKSSCSRRLFLWRISCYNFRSSTLKFLSPLKRSVFTFFWRGVVLKGWKRDACRFLWSSTYADCIRTNLAPIWRPAFHPNWFLLINSNYFLFF